MTVELAATAVKPEQFPTAGLPEFAFAGKSNVGKSSLLNCMIERKSLARTSAAPGKTRTINFYQVENRVLFVDLPGYGYAQVSKTESQKWSRMVERYLQNREPLLSVLLLVDIRHDPGPMDRQLMDWLRYYSFDAAVVATKSDKIGRNIVAGRIAAIRTALELPKDADILPFSSETRDGREQLWQRLEQKMSTRSIL